ncbi:CAMP-binding protein-catabolite activator and regulatory subunit of cAMP-dependent protein kinase [Sulfitobacter noctilucae]|uniref:Crp/Fnr family transcriptional regulator n=1 Tax=Sulfitobacter noctilucae TaxID=1342302 RepID=UPI000469059C|nr:Crp/Fnr family transcriptional regulator [Sulfitobacter noctilucae]KIN75246.1 CAMP-binding protein-catabolite activator and regulatory subunit of cAMP-dependent protein kinase [Sulfitobacter noctilucae]
MTSHNDQDALRSCFLFTSLSDDDIGILSQMCRSVSYPRGAEIFAMGDTADGLRIITAGEVRIWVSDAEGRELTVTILEDGDSFGEIALLDGLPRTAAASATEATTCLFVPHSAVDALLQSNPRFAREMIHCLCEILRRNTDEMGAMTFQSLDARLAQKLCDLAMSRAVIDGATARFTKKLSQADLAKMLGVTREAVNKRLMALVHDDLIETQDGFLVIPDLDKLASRSK